MMEDIKRDGWVQCCHWENHRHAVLCMVIDYATSWVVPAFGLQGMQLAPVHHFFVMFLCFHVSYASCLRLHVLFVFLGTVFVHFWMSDSGSHLWVAVRSGLCFQCPNEGGWINCNHVPVTFLFVFWSTEVKFRFFAPCVWLCCMFKTLLCL